MPTNMAMWERYNMLQSNICQEWELNPRLHLETRFPSASGRRGSLSLAPSTARPSWLLWWDSTVELTWFCACSSCVACSEKPAWSLLILLLGFWAIELEKTFFKDAQEHWSWCFWSLFREPDPGSCSSKALLEEWCFSFEEKKKVSLLLAE